MSYRKITVNDTQYEYVIGKKFIKIKSIGLFPVESSGYNGIITPEVIKYLILNQPLPALECKRHNYKSHTLTSDPLEAEILRRNVLVIDCPRCLQESASEI